MILTPTFKHVSKEEKLKTLEKIQSTLKNCIKDFESIGATHYPSYLDIEATILDMEADINRARIVLEEMA